jgi:hypothetical protein
MEPYPQPFPNILKVVDPLKSYKWRDFHGEREEKSKKHCYFDCGSFEQGLDEEDSGRLLQHHMRIVSFLLNLSLMYLAYFLHVCVYMFLSMVVLIYIDKLILSNPLE